MKLVKSKPKNKAKPTTVTLPRALVPGAKKYALSAAEASQLDDQIATWRLRVAGKSIPTIAKELKLPIDRVRELLAITVEMLKSEFKDDIEGFKQLELARTDKLIEAFEGDLSHRLFKETAGDMILKTMKHRATLVGLDKQRVEHVGVPDAPIRVYHGADLSHIHNVTPVPANLDSKSLPSKEDK